MLPLHNPQRDDAQGIIWTLSRRILMVIALTLAFFLSALITIFIMFRSGDARVPDVIGKTEVEAKSVMEANKFEVKIQRRADDTPINTVIETRPAPNSSVKTNSVITIVISSGPGQNKSQLYVEPTDNPLATPWYGVAQPMASALSRLP
jgi:PASTA domain-containing protein